VQRIAQEWLLFVESKIIHPADDSPTDILTRKSAQTEIFGRHRVTCCKEYRKPPIDLTTLYGLDVLEEDR